MSLPSMEDIAAPTAVALPSKLTYWQMSALVAGLEADNRKLRRANEALGSWLSAALVDENVCQEMKDVVVKWFEATEKV